MADGKIVIETGLDTTGIENGLGKISSLAQKGLATATKTITATSAALSGMGGYAVKVGSSFEAAMSQVAATMGMSKKKSIMEVQNLQNYKKLRKMQEQQQCFRQLRRQMH